MGAMLDYFSLIHKYYPPGTQAHKIFIVHAVLVTNKALTIGRRLKLKPDDLEFLEEASMLHDLGVCQVEAPKMACHGKLPYIAHGLAGAELLRAAGLPAHALVAQRHVGVGLTKAEIISRGLPLPPQDFIPQTIVEKIITYADSFFSKRETTLWIEEDPAAIKAELAQYGAAQVAIFEAWMKEFG
jgi:uncharacterized protein